MYCISVLTHLAPGDTRYKRPYGDVPPTSVAKSASSYMNDPLHVYNAKFGIWMGLFFKIFQNMSQNWRKFQNILENQVILLNIRLIGVWIIHFFLKNWYLYGSTFNFCGGTFLPKANLSTPWALSIRKDNMPGTAWHFPLDLALHLTFRIMFYHCITWRPYLSFSRKEKQTGSWSSRLENARFVLVQFISSMVAWYMCPSFGSKLYSTLIMDMMSQRSLFRQDN